MTSKYNKSKHCLVEQNHLPPPRGNDLQYSRDFSKHVQSLRTIPCQPGTIWEEDRVYEEGKDYEVLRGVFNIHSEAGRKVTVTDISINNGYDSDAEKANKYLKPGNIYTVERTRVDSWFTDVWLNEFPDIRFNSVHFVSPYFIAMPIVPAIPIPKEDNLWEELILGFIQHYASHTRDIVIAELKKKYTLTKKTV